MQAFQYQQAPVKSRGRWGSASPHTKFVAGGTTLIDLMKLNVERPTTLIDINSLALDKIEKLPDGGTENRSHGPQQRSGARPNGSEHVCSPLAGAALRRVSAAPQHGNDRRQSACSALAVYYFRDTAYACNKRNPGSGCAAIDGFNRIHAILGTSEHCIATHPSDMAVAMMALEAIVQIRGRKGRKRRSRSMNSILCPAPRRIARMCLQPGELIIFVTLPALASGTRSYYLKRRDRASYEFALASAAVVAQMQGQNLQRVSIALGGVGTKPWRSEEAEQALEGREASEANFRTAAEAALRGAKPLHDNAFKVELARRTLDPRVESRDRSCLASRR